jgi:Flp pilus assembly protein TadG
MRRFRILKRIRRETKGAAAIEFAIIAPVFFLLMWSIFETGLVFFASQTLNHGLQVTARQIRTGQAHEAQLTQTQFRDDVCEEIDFVLSCDANKLYLDVRAFSSFAGVGFPPPLDADGNFDNVNMNQFNLGVSGSISGGSSIVLVRGFYVWQLFTPVFGEYFSNMQGNNRLLSASVAFKNEPF